MRAHAVEPGHEGPLVMSCRLGKSDLPWTALVTSRAADKLGLREQMQVRLSMIPPRLITPIQKRAGSDVVIRPRADWTLAASVGM